MGQANRAIVLGSGIAGLVTARVLSAHFDEVIVIEKDSEPREAGFRPGVPQGHHFHALIPGGLEVMNRLMPGLKADLVEAGSILPKRDQFYFYLPEGKSYSQAMFQPEPPGEDLFEPAYVQTRGLLEFTVRKRVMGLENVVFRYGTAVREPLVDAGRVTGVRVDKTDEAIPADVVIDAMGKTGRTSAWLRAIGFAPPSANVINCDFAYTSVFLAPDDPSLFTDVGFFVAPAAGSAQFRGGALVRMEDGSWLALVGGRYGDYPPRDFSGFLDWAKTLSEPRFFDLVSRATPIGQPAHFRFPRGVRRRFDLLTEFPEGLLPVGDSVCHFNPAYGQGMTSASLQAMALAQVLSKHGGWPDGLWHEAFAAMYQVTRAPWLFAATADFMHPECTGDFPQEEMEALAALGALRERAMTGDRQAYRQLMNVSMLKVPLSSILPATGGNAEVAVV